MRPLCAHYAPTMRPLCAHYVHKPFWSGTGGTKVCPLCAHYAPTMRPLCPQTVLALCRWVQSAPNMRPLCAHYAPTTSIKSRSGTGGTKVPPCAQPQSTPQKTHPKIRKMAAQRAVYKSRLRFLGGTLNIGCVFWEVL